MSSTIRSLYALAAEKVQDPGQLPGSERPTARDSQAWRDGEKRPTGAARPTGAWKPRAVPQVRGLNVVLIEDDEDLRELLRAELAGRSHFPRAFGSAEEALESGGLEHADVLLVDHQLPGMTGVELCQHLQNELPDLPVVVMTAFSSMASAIAALRAGASDYVLKPATTEAVEYRLSRAVTDQRKRIEVRRQRSHRRIKLASGDTVPGTPYRIQRWLGEGGMGTVFEAIHVDIERRVALKILHAAHSQDEAASHTFRNEARASARIGAPNIVEILDFQELEDGRLMFAMEFLDGHDLAREIGQPELTLARMLGIARQICKGLTAAHEAGIVHRDMKPDNIMLVAKDGREDFVKLVDFGIAGFLTDSDDRIGLAGTPQYMAPELIRGEGFDGRLDLYGVGCILYEFVTGHPPFDGKNTLAVLEAQVERLPVPPSELVGEAQVPPAFETLILRCLAKDPDDRFADLDDLEAALCELQIELGLQTPWDDLPLPDVDPDRRARLAERMPSTARPRRRLWTVVLGTAAVASCLSVGGAIALGATGPQAGAVVESDAVSDHVARARAAASRFYFVYPPVGDPAGSTALREVRAIEGLRTEPAAGQATLLRGEFADTLERLGDRYWEEPGGRPFAGEYYAMALMFDEQRPRARERSSVSAGTLAYLEERASAGEFSEAELRAAAPLAALAEEDPTIRDRKLADLKKDRGQSLTNLARLEHLEGIRSAAAKKTAIPKPPPPPVAAVATVPDPPSAQATEDPEQAQIPRGQTRDPARAKELATQGDALRRSNEAAKAEQLYHQALDADQRNLQALDGLAILFFDLADYSKALKYAEKAAKRGPKSATRWLRLGDAYFKVLRYRDALAAYERADALGSPQAQNRIARAQSRVSG